jgi:hypothetical protein
MNNTQRQKWLRDLRVYEQSQKELEQEVKDLQAKKLQKKKQLKDLKRDKTKLERRLYGR